MKAKSIAHALTCAVTVAALGATSLAQAQQWQPANGGPHGRGAHGGAVQQRPSQGQPSHQWQNQRPGQRQWQGQQWQGQQWQGQRWQAQRSWAPAQAPRYAQRYAPGYRAPHHDGYVHAPRYYGHGPAYYAGPRYAVGGYVPYAFRAHRYWVNDWRAYNLAPPPYGYTWVETDSGDFLLMALATGLIASIILNQ